MARFSDDESSRDSSLVYGEYDGIDTNRKRNLDRRRETSRYAARDRRGKEADIFSDLKDVVPIVEESTVTHVDRIALLRVASTMCRMRRNAGKFLETELPQEDPQIHCFTEQNMTECLDGFVLLADSDGTILYVSESVSIFLGLTQTDLVGRFLKEFVHSNDYDELIRASTTSTEVQDTASSLDEFGRYIVVRMKTVISPRGRNLNLKSALFKAILCRFRAVNTEYGRLSLLYGSSTPAGQGNSIMLANASVKGSEATNGVYMTRHTCDMRFSYVSDSLNYLLRHDARSLMGTSFYDIVHPSDMIPVAESMKELFQKGHCRTPFYRLLGSNSSVAWVQTEATTVNHTARGQKGQYVLCVHSVVGMQSELDAWSEPVVDGQMAAHPAICVSKIKHEIPDMAEYMGKQPEFVDCVDFTPLIEPIIDINYDDYSNMNGMRGHGNDIEIDEDSIYSDLEGKEQGGEVVIGENGDQEKEKTMDKEDQSEIQVIQEEVANRNGHGQDEGDCLTDLEDCWKNPKICNTERRQWSYSSSSDDLDTRVLSSSEDDVVIIIPKKKFKKSKGQRSTREWVKQLRNSISGTVKCGGDVEPSSSGSRCVCCGARNEKEVAEMCLQKKNKAVPTVPLSFYRDLIQKVFICPWRCSFFHSVLTQKRKKSFDEVLDWLVRDEADSPPPYASFFDHNDECRADPTSSSEYNSSTFRPQQFGRYQQAQFDRMPYSNGLGQNSTAPMAARDRFECGASNPTGPISGAGRPSAGCYAADGQNYSAMQRGSARGQQPQQGFKAEARNSRFTAHMRREVGIGQPNGLLRQGQPASAGARGAAPLRARSASSRAVPTAPASDVYLMSGAQLGSAARRFPAGSPLHTAMRAACDPKSPSYTRASSTSSNRSTFDSAAVRRYAQASPSPRNQSQSGRSRCSSTCSGLGGTPKPREQRPVNVNQLSAVSTAVVHPLDSPPQGYQEQYNKFNEGPVCKKAAFGTEKPVYKDEYGRDFAGLAPFVPEEDFLQLEDLDLKGVFPDVDFSEFFPDQSSSNPGSAGSLPMMEQQKRTPPCFDDMFQQNVNIQQQQESIVPDNWRMTESELW
ncbi:unnamed protein product [Bursaphelenchus xylophilus]|uniref:(pine wood nematode) hypothetical protein n=1 Tax=Bursaphelenchus xylophilus TaxID=6326 RepID=A0A1I7RSY8_BURXY|nr:unnamed protein product [Bursaphelenchus xylophilus]CAG9122729.1 unnamed protein product [Bursaphelenchus xylophilus]